MLTHPKSTMRVLCMLTYLSSGNVATGVISIPKTSSRVGLTAPGGLTLGSAYISS